MFQGNIYYIKGVLCICGKDVPRRAKKSLKFSQTNQDSCACTRFLCMHNTLVHAQHSCACTGGARAQGRDPKRALGVRPGPWPVYSMFSKTQDFWAKALGPWAHGPRPLGPMGPSIFCDFLKICFMVWDLSGRLSYGVRSQGNPLIHFTIS